MVAPLAVGVALTAPTVLTPDPPVALTGLARHSADVASYISSIAPPTGMVMSAPVPVVIWLAATLLPLRLDSVTAKAASVFTSVSC